MFTVFFWTRFLGVQKPRASETRALSVLSAVEVELVEVVPEKMWADNGYVNGKSTIWRSISNWKWGYSTIAMLVYQGVYFYKYLQINLEIVNLYPFSQHWDVLTRIPQISRGLKNGVLFS